VGVALGAGVGEDGTIEAVVVVVVVVEEEEPDEEKRKRPKNGSPLQSWVVW
jgi:hypothetical protein